MRPRVIPLVLSGSSMLGQSFLLICVGIGWAMSVWKLRRSTLGLPDDAGLPNLLPFACAFVLGVIAGGIPALALFHLRRCSFARSVPGMSKAAASELAAVGAVLTVSLLALGFVIYGIGIGDPCLLAAVSLLGYALVSVISILRGTATLWLAAAVIASFYFLPEIVHFSRDLALVWLLALIGGTGVWFAFFPRRVQAASGFSVESRGITRARPARQEKARVSLASNSGVPLGRSRITGIEWVRASLHESYGGFRGGIVGFVAGNVGAAILVAISFVIPAAMNESHTPAGGRTAENADALQMIWPFIASIAFVSSTYSAAGSTKQCMRYPIARRRKASVLWWRKQVEELHLLGVLLVTAELIRVIGQSVIPSMGSVTQAPLTMTLIAFSAVPLVRCVMFESFVERSVRQQEKPHAGEALPWLMVAATLMTICCIAAAGVWSSAELGLRSMLGLYLPAWIPLFWLPVIAAIRWMWYLEVHRVFSRCDLPTP